MSLPSQIPSLLAYLQPVPRWWTHDPALLFLIPAMNSPSWGPITQRLSLSLTLVK